MEGAQVALAVFISITFFLILIIGLYLYFSKYVHISWQMLLKKRINYIMTREKNLNIHSIIFTIFGISTYFQHGNTTASLCHAMREAVQMQSHAMCMQAFSNINFWTLSQTRSDFGLTGMHWKQMKIYLAERNCQGISIMDFRTMLSKRPECGLKLVQKANTHF